MINRDILSRFFKENYEYNKKNKFSSSNHQRRNYLKKYNIINTENNILKFTPKTITTNQNYNKINIKPYNLSVKNAFTKELFEKKINKSHSKKNLSLNNNITFNKSQILYNIHNNKNNSTLNNNDNPQNKTSSTYFISRSNQINPIQISPITRIKDIISPGKNTIKSYNKIDEEANKIVKYYLSTDLSNNKQRNKEIKDINNYEKIRNNIINKYLMDKKLLKMKNINHKILTGNFASFKSFNIQIKALGTRKSRQILLKGIEDYYINQTYRSLNDYAIKNIGKNNIVENSKIKNEFEFDENKSKFALSERIKKKNNIKNRVNKNIINNFYSFNKAKSIDKKKFMNFYEKLNFLQKRVKLTNEHILKRIEIRQKFKDNINSLLITNI